MSQGKISRAKLQDATAKFDCTQNMSRAIHGTIYQSGLDLADLGPDRGSRAAIAQFDKAPVVDQSVVDEDDLIAAPERTGMGRFVEKRADIRRLSNIHACSVNQHTHRRRITL
ncbi:hypothetical protein [Bradyrhizobium neotropicale]|uniref:hypothetical protein n=1 Tax=Bradyrhizobium neotropicale TaxID=1497615 RepID=UPI001AD61453|nr:hypothetical protein [Bradyrhizobium neotropicale]MBO4222637.1 hypothetical protein [Bradyrhizobium neotropicale]